MISSLSVHKAIKAFLKMLVNNHVATNISPTTGTSIEPRDKAPQQKGLGKIQKGLVKAKKGRSKTNTGQTILIVVVYIIIVLIVVFVLYS
jgi:hypothetical protein